MRTFLLQNIILRQYYRQNISLCVGCFLVVERGSWLYERLSNIEGGFWGQSGLCTSTLRGHNTIYKGQGGGVLGGVFP